MTRAISKDDLCAALLKGVESAQKKYSDSTGGFWLWEAPEYLICVSLMDAVREQAKQTGKKLYVSLETNVHSCLKDAGAIQRGALPKKLRSRGRFDLVIWWGGGEPRAAIEVKNQVYTYSQIRTDVERVIDLVKRNSEKSSFQFGAVVFFTSVESKQRAPKDVLEKRISNLYEHARKDAGSGVKVYKNVGSTKVADSENAWVACCLSFKVA